MTPEVGAAAAATGADPGAPRHGGLRRGDLGLAPPALRPGLAGRPGTGAAGGRRPAVRGAARRGRAGLVRRLGRAHRAALPLQEPGLRRRDGALHGHGHLGGGRPGRPSTAGSTSSAPTVASTGSRSRLPARRCGCDERRGSGDRRRGRVRPGGHRSVGAGPAGPGRDPGAGRRRADARRRRRAGHDRDLPLLRDPARRLPGPAAVLDRLDLRRRHPPSRCTSPARRRRSRPGSAGPW